MGDSLFDIFGNNLIKHAGMNVVRQPLTNNENMGKAVLNVPVKPNEPMKKGEVKKSFLSNTGKALQSSPRQVFTPRAVNVGALIYSDPDVDDKKINDVELEFTRPTYKYDNYHTDIHDYLGLPLPEIMKQPSPPRTPPPAIKTPTMELDDSYQDELFFTGNYLTDIQYDESALPYPEIMNQISPPRTPPPLDSYQDEFFTDDFSIESIQDDSLDLSIIIYQ